MSGAWIAAFALLALLSVVNAVVLVAVMRQVGVLHERVRPTGFGEIAGPPPGAVLRAPSLTTVGGAVARRQPEAPIWIAGYVTPGCGLCEGLPGIMQAYGRHASAGMDLFLVTDVPEGEARAFLRHAGDMPFTRAEGLRDEYAIPGSPYVLALQRTGDAEVTVLAGGIVNTLEQLEDLGDRAEATVRGSAPPTLELQHITTAGG